MLDIYYTITVVFAFLILFIINKEVHSSYKDDEKQGLAEYKWFIRSIELFLLTDASWGIVHKWLDATYLYYDAMVYNITMAMTVMMCCRYVSKFLELQNKGKGKILNVFGIGFFITDIIMVIVNIFAPILFWLDEEGNYHTGIGRQIGMGILVIVFVLMGIIAFHASRETSGKRKQKIVAIVYFSAFMTSSLFAQTMFPFFPCYSLGLVTAVIIIYIHIHVAEQITQIEKITALNDNLKEKQTQIEHSSLELLKMKRMLDISNIGTWELVTQEGHKPRLATDDKFKELMGIPTNSAISEEELNDLLLSRVNPADMPAFKAYDEKLRKGKPTECTYRWQHLTKGERYFRCGGALVSDQDGIVIAGGYHSDVTDQMKTEKELQLSIAANEAKTKFLQNMSHEIRTPLNAMFGFAQLLGMPDGAWTDDEKINYNKIINNSFHMLDMLINDILDSADIQHGNYRMNISEFTVNEVGRNALSCVEFRRPGKVEMTFSSDIDDSYSITSDPRRVQQILINYLTNACKNTIQGEIRLHITNKTKPGVLSFYVSDTGKGVPADKAEMIFGRFTKLDKFAQGSGLGLNICHTIATKLGGKVYLDTTYTEGAKFVLELSESN